MDAAQSPLAHIDFSIADLGWVTTSAAACTNGSAPPSALGRMLYTCNARTKIERLWPLMGDPKHGEPGDIRKFERMGTRPDQHVIAPPAKPFAFHEKNLTGGHQRKEARLRQLHTHWADAVRDWPDIVLTPRPIPRGTGPWANVSVLKVWPSRRLGRLPRRAPPHLHRGH